MTRPSGSPARGPGRAGGSPLRLLSLALAASLLLADQLSKHWATQHLPPGQLRPFLPGLLSLQRVTNTGAAFSLFSGSTQTLGLVSLVVSLAVLLWILRSPPRGLWLSLGLGFLLGGAAGNGIDRWRHGAVTDFLAFVPIDFPVFNLADVAINLAVVCLLIDQLPQLGIGGGGGPRGSGHDPGAHG
ncbi:MAG: signal peptidase II [Cyanobium sp.]